MQHPGHPTGPDDPREFERLRTLASYGLLDTPGEGRYDDLARLASRLCATPMALVTLVDDRRQWFKSAIGLELRQTPRDIAFCAHTIAMDGLLEVPDACLDPRFADNPLVTGDPGLRFYAGVPLRVEGGHALGSLAVLDCVPRRLSDQQRQDLSILAAQVVLLMEERLQRRRAEDALAESRRQSESLLAIAGQVASLGAWELDLANGRVVWSDVVADIHGMPRGFAPAMDEALAFYREPDRTTLAARIEACRQTGEPFDLELVLQPQNQAPRWVRAIGHAIRDGQGRITHLRGACQDITRREEALARLRLLDTCIRRLNDAVLITDARADPPGPTIVFANQAIERLCGWRPEELVGQSPRGLQGPQTQRDRLDALRDAVAHCRPLEVELINHHRSGEPYWVELKLSPIHDDAGHCTHFVAVERDITERKLAEERREALEAQLRQAQKMESIGTLAGGVAHDFNNILGSVLGSLELARDQLPPDSAARRPLDTIETAAQRARALVQQILAFGRQQATLRQRQALQPLVCETLQLLRSTLPASVSLESAVAREPLWAEIDANQLQQVLVNLCTNAWHALPRTGGRIEVGLEATGPEAEPGAQGAPPEAAMVHLWVRDDGCGIDPQALPRIFEPFFTTKAVGHGTGLGLSVAHGIVTAHDGTITVDSTPGRGTVFHVRLPASPPRAESGEHRTDHAVAEVPLRGLRVLCVDDDPVMLITIEALLKREGCPVVALESPTEALSLLTRSPGSVDVLVTDYNMPEMDGLALIAAARRVSAGLPVVLASGFLNAALRVRAAELGVHALVMKERTVEDLTEAVRDALRAPAAKSGSAAPQRVAMRGDDDRYRW